MKLGKAKRKATFHETLHFLMSLFSMKDDNKMTSFESNQMNLLTIIQTKMMLILSKLPGMMMILRKVFQSVKGKIFDLK